MLGLTLLSILSAVGAQYTATYLPSNAPQTSEDNQYGTNQCGGGSNQTSLCQNAYINGVDDFCIWAPPASTYEGNPSLIANTEQVEVAWCMRSGYGTRLIPDGTVTGAHFIQTPNYVQVLGVGDLTKINIPGGDDGGELDPHGYDGNGNPIGGLVFGTSFGELQQYHEWTNFVWYGGFCFRACIDGPMAPTYCNHIYDVLGCGWNMPGNYSDNIFETCLANNTEPMGVYGTSTFHQGDASTPDAHTPAPSSDCVFMSTISNKPAVAPTATLLPSSVSASLASVTASESRASASSVAATSSTASASASKSGSASSTTSASAGASGAARVAFGGLAAWAAVACSLLGVLVGVYML